MFLRNLIWLFFLAPWGAHADSVLVNEALKQLIERQESSVNKASRLDNASTHKAMPPPSVKRRTESLHANETLDGLIKRTWPGLPSKDTWVRKTYVDLNPKAFVQGNPNLLQPGSAMIIPTKEDLRSSFTKAQPSIAALFDPGDVSQVESVKTESEKPSPARWVRFP
jgi:hypothetical protein